MSLLRTIWRHRPRLLVIAAAFYGVLGVVAGPYLIATSINEHTEVLSAQLSTSVIGRETDVDFEFEDGSVDSQFAPRDSFFNAVEKFGPGPARVTRNADNKTIDKVRFHGKTYTLSTTTDAIGGGIFAVILGVLALAYAIRQRHRVLRPAGFG